MRPGSTLLQKVVLLLHAVLILGIPIWSGLKFSWVVLPLLLPLPGLLRGRPYTYAWACMLQLFYVGALMMGALEGDALATALAVAGALQFCAMLLFVRVRAAELRNARAQVTPD